MEIMLVWLFLIALNFAYSESVQVQLKNGTIRGFSKGDETQVYVFLGIPYAQPPLGKLRFREPLPISERWPEVKDATKWPHVCPQPKGRKFLAAQNEDCLYLNVWTSTLSTDLLKPVMVWIHGGAFVNFSSSYKYFDGYNMAATGDVVVVTINYRLGVLGFLFGDDGQVPGNQALHDQVMALRWVEENIPKFGGDPNKVTLFGESAGGRSVSLHMLSPLSRDLFSRAIIMSGVAIDELYVDSKEVAIKKTKRLIQELGCPTSGSEGSLSEEEKVCLRSTPVENLIRAQSNIDVSTVENRSVCVGFCPIFGDKLLPMSPIVSLSGGHYKKASAILIGTVANEGMILYQRARAANQIPFDSLTTTEDWLNYTSVVFESRLPSIVYISSQIIRKSYFANATNENIDTSKAAHMAALGDAVFDCPTEYFARHLTEGNDLFQYVFKYQVSKPELSVCEIFGPCHGNDVPYIFGTPENKADKSAANKWMKILVSFAVNGTLVNSHKRTGTYKPYLTFEGQSQTVNHNYKYEQCELFIPKFVARSRSDCIR